MGGVVFLKKLAGTGGGCATMFAVRVAGIAQLVEQLICNQQVVGSSPTAGSLYERDLRKARKSLALLNPKKYS